MEKIYMLDTDTAALFNGLCPEDLVRLLEKGRVAFGMMDDEKPVALVVATLNTFSLFIDWIYVEKGYRRDTRGQYIVNVLIDNLGSLSYDGYVHVACDEELKPFFTELDFEFSDDEKYKTFLNYIDEIAEIPLPKPDKSIKRVADLTNAEKNIIYQTLLADEKASLGLELPIDWDSFMPQSYVFIKENKLHALLFFNEENGGINVAYAYTSGNNVKALFSLVAVAMDEIADDYDEDTVITATALNEPSAVLFSELFPDANISYLVRGRRRV